MLSYIRLDVRKCSVRLKLRKKAFQKAKSRTLYVERDRTLLRMARGTAAIKFIRKD